MISDSPTATVVGVVRGVKNVRRSKDITGKRGGLNHHMRLIYAACEQMHRATLSKVKS